MTTPNFVILYVDSPEDSGAFYAKLLGREPVESSPTFVMFVLDRGFKLGLWSRHTVEPAAAAMGGGGEIVIAVADASALGELQTRHGFPVQIICAVARRIEQPEDREQS